ncbi:hypothetical protein D9M71_526260 [compost metagenome]
MRPSLGCSRSSKKPTACRCGSSISDSMVCIGITGISAPSSASIHSALVRVSMISATIRYSSWICSVRLPMLLKRGSLSISSGLPISSKNARHCLSL